MPAHLSLRYAPDVMEAGGGDYVLVPLTFQEKGVLRQFNIEGPDGTALSILGRREDLPLVRGVLQHELQDALCENYDEGRLLETLAVIIDGDPERAQLHADRLGVEGMIDDEKVLETGALSTWAKRLLTILPSNYLMVALVPAGYAGHRVVLKYSLEWSIQPLHLNYFNRAWAAFGFDDFAFRVELSHPSGAASHHLEVVFPDGLEARALTMPSGTDTDTARRNTTDTGPLGVLHGVGRYSQDANAPEPAHITFGPTRGLRQLTFMVLLTTSVILCLGRWLPNAQNALLAANDGAAALLLAVPAVVLALLARQGENAVVSHASSVLRHVVIFCALLLLACAGSIVGHLCSGPRLALWALGGIVSGVLGGALICGALRQGNGSVTRDDHDDGMEDGRPKGEDDGSSHEET
ncbi:hypothetical protein [Ornithinimicrobium cryptoxanthini]|uniref:Uncharacterized protein n=1 Tax=Ornithinimicrobium cryptoxanthini TaxID=2934161 RepID=A0ABY4YF03_9MICO|nr:hypothetical protein [Ornithinimicrobium cryptoxanthini]USQ75355.1 hypothetical protein NF557_12075 [Ornithinimicrobium cryptoxanthini]